MHKDFGEWYRLVDIVPDDALLTRRWAGVEAWCSDTKDDTGAMLDIVRVFLERPAADAQIVERFKACFQKHDAAFPQRNALELQVLAGATIANCIATESADDGRGMTVALAVAAGGFRVARPATKLAEIEDLARQHLVQMSWRRRARESEALENLAHDQPLKGALEEFSKAPLPNPDQLRTAITPVLQAVTNTIARLQNALLSMHQDLTRADEECNILWWLQGGCSRDMRTPWDAVSREAVPVITAKELADLTEVLPGPHTAQAILHAVIPRVGSGGVTLRDAVNGVPMDWLRSSLDSRVASHITDLTPGWLALKSRAAVADNDAWLASYAKGVGIDPAKELRADDLAGHLYVEALLLKALTSES